MAVVYALADFGIRGVFPFGLSWEAVLWKEDAVLNAGRTPFFAVYLGGAQVLEASAVLLRVFALLVEVHFAVEVLVVSLSVHYVQDTLVDEDLLIDAVGAPLAVAHGLFPVDTNYRVEVVGRVAQVVLYVHVVQAKLVAPYQRIRQCRLVDLWVVVVVVDSAKPVKVFSVVGVGHFVLVEVE